MSGGKGKGKHFLAVVDQQIRTNSDNEFPGAIRREEYLLALSRTNQWKLAKVVEIRYAEGYKKPEKEDGKVEEESKQKPPKFEYYINYAGQERRNDRWVTEEEIRYDCPDEIQKERDNLEQDIEEQKKQLAQFFENDEHVGLNEKQRKEFEESTKVKTVDFIEIGKNRLEAWYFSPLPREYHGKTLYICEYCLFFFRAQEELIRHSMKCKIRYPPGDEIYRDDAVSMFELDGKNHQVYCENLCLIAKLFLDHKTLYFDIDPFHFYVLCEHDEDGYHFVGYFSKEKGNADNNLSCIMVMPYCQRNGYGKFLIEFSYELSLKEGRTGTPERPLSDLGHRSYVSWWTQRLLKILLSDERKMVSIQDLANQTSIDMKDIVYVLENYKILRYQQGNHILYTDKDYLQEILKMTGRAGRPVIRENIHWVPHTYPTMPAK